MLLAASVCPLMEEAKTLVSRLRPSYHLAAAFSLSLDVGYLFLVGSSVLLSVAVQQLVTTLVLSQQEMNAWPSTPPSWTGSLLYIFDLGTYSILQGRRWQLSHQTEGKPTDTVWSCWFFYPLAVLLLRYSQLKNKVSKVFRSLLSMTFFLVFSSVTQLCVWLFVTPWTAAFQVSLSITNSWSLLKLISIKSVMPSSHLILCHHPCLLPPSIFPSIRVFPNESVLHIR